MKSIYINDNEVHVYSAFLLEYRNTDYLYSILSRDECVRANSFRFSEDQMQFIITRGILRQLLSNYLGQAPESIKIIYGLSGKPCLPEENSLHFNLSHSRSYALYAITRNHEVGIDLEYIDKNLELGGLAPFIFSATELIDWKNFDEEERINAFFSRWVSKEALLKALGRGWLANQSELYFNEEERYGSGIHKDKTKTLYCFEIIPGYASALFVEGALLTPLYYSWNQNSKIDSVKFKIQC